MKKVLETRNDKTIPSDFIIELLDLVLKYNIFVFDSQLYRQLIGTAIGTKCAPNVADIFMSFIDEKIRIAAMKFSENGISPLLLYRRFLDDCLFIFLGSNDNLHRFLDEITLISPSIKFMMQHTKKVSDDDSENQICKCELCDSIPFLDTSLSIREGKINSDLYRKPSDRVQYLLPSSCHPPQYRQYPLQPRASDSAYLYRHGGT